MNRYTTVMTIGRGKESKVKLAKDRQKEDELVAIKYIYVPEDTDDEKEVQILYEGDEDPESYRRQKQILREIESMKKIGQHRNVVALRNVFEDLQKRRMGLVMEYVGGGDLFELLDRQGKLEEKRARMFFWQLMRGLKHIHACGIVHRDLKPENLLLDVKHKTLKISDFGLCGMLKKHKKKLFSTYCGTENYCCPELLSGQSYDGELADIWSCGCILYTMLAGIYPFQSEVISELIQSILSVEYVILDFFSASAADLIRRILVKDPQERLSAEEIMQHPWMLEGEEEIMIEENYDSDDSDSDDSDE